MRELDNFLTDTFVFLFDYSEYYTFLMIQDHVQMLYIHYKIIFYLVKETYCCVELVIIKT